MLRCDCGAASNSTRRMGMVSYPNDDRDIKLMRRREVLSRTYETVKMDFTFDSPIAPTNPINTFAQDFTQPTQ